MTPNTAFQKIKAARERLKALEQRVATSPAAEALVIEALEELAIPLEELQMAPGELHALHEELVAAHQVAETERQRYQELFEFAPDGYLMTDAKGVIQEANYAVAALLGVFQNALVGKPLIVYVAEQDHQTFHTELEKLQQGDVKSVRDWEIELKPRDGTSFPASLTVGLVCNADGQLTGLRWMLRDITERKRAEEVLKRRVAQLALLNDVGRQILAVIELENVLDTAARLVHKSFGYHHVALFAVDREQGELIMRAKAGGYADRFPFDHRLGSGQGMVGWVGLHGLTLLANNVHAEPRYINLFPDTIPTLSELSVPIKAGKEMMGVLDIQSPQLNAFDESDVKVMETLADQIAVAIENARLYEAVQQELAERKAAETALRESEQRYSSLFQNNHAVMLLIDPNDGAIVEANPMACSYYGYSLKELTTLKLWDINTLCREDVLREMGRARFGKQRHSYFQHRLASGDIRDVEVYNGPITVGGQQLLYSIVHDITERRRLEAQLVQSAKMASLGVMAGGIAHELRNPLGIISANIELMMERAHDPELRSQCGQKILAATQRASQIIENLLNFARPQGYRFRKVDLHIVLDETLVMLDHQMKLQQVMCVKEYQPDLPSVHGNPGLLQQVFTNLILNACNAMPNGGTLTVGTRDAGDNQVEIWFKDTGLGMSPELLSKIFDPFFTTMPVGKGTGLGLSVSYSLIQQHHGTIEVEGQLGRGAQFTIRLPCMEES